MKKIQTLREMVNLAPSQKTWYRIENAAADVADVFIYGYIGWDVTASEFVAEIRKVTAKAMNVHIATEGGDVFDGIAILNSLRSHAAVVTTIVDSQALSAGSFILQAGDVRKVAKNGTVMVHDASSGGFGNAQDMREAADLLDKASDNIAGIYADRSGGTVADWRTVMRAETWYTADEAVAAGLADEVIDFSAKNTAQPGPITVRDKIDVVAHTVATPVDQAVQPVLSFADQFRAALQEVS